MGREKKRKIYICLESQNGKCLERKKENRKERKKEISLLKDIDGDIYMQRKKDENRDGNEKEQFREDVEHLLRG